jgi:hypothetical protein
MIATAEPAKASRPAPSTPKVSPIETLQKTVSASRLNCWLSCRFKFFFRYVQQIPKPKTPPLPPDFLWCSPSELPSGVIYKPDLAAIGFILERIRRARSEDQCITL